MTEFIKSLDMSSLTNSVISSYLNQLPSELLISEIFTTLSYQDIKNLCLTNTAFAAYCAKDKWALIFRSKYPEVYTVASRYQARGIVKDYEYMVKQMERIDNNEVESVIHLTLELVICAFLEQDYIYKWNKLFKHTDHTEALLSTKYLLSLKDDQIDLNKAFQMAAAYGHVEVLQFLMDLGDDRIDPSARDNRAFRWAAENGHVEVLQFLMDLEDERIDPSVNNNQAFRMTAEKGHVEVLQFLTDLGDERIDPSAEDNYAFRWAAVKGHVEVLQFLMDLGDDRIDPSAGYNYSFRRAAADGHVEVLQFLMDLGDERIDPSARDNYAFR